MRCVCCGSECLEEGRYTIVNGKVVILTVVCDECGHEMNVED